MEVISAEAEKETAETLSCKAKMLDKLEVIFDLVCETIEILTDALT